MKVLSIAKHVRSSLIGYRNEGKGVGGEEIFSSELGCHPVAVVILHVYKILNWLLINLSRESCTRSKT